MAVLTNQNGTSSADTLTYNKAGTYHAGAGTDTIKIEGGSGIVVYSDSGNNIINVIGGSQHTVKVAVADTDSEKQNGVEKLAINGANQVDAYLGSGKDEILLRYSDGRKISGALSQIHGGGWTDTFTIGNGAQRYQLYGDAGNDIFEITAGSNIVCWGGAANDTFNVTGGNGIKLRGGDSADIYNIQKGSQAVDMQLGYGNDVVNVDAGDKHTIKANLGINTINLKAGSGHIITADIDQAASKKKGFTDEQIKAGQGLGYGVDKVYISGTATKVTANLGDGRDGVEVRSGSGHKIYTEGWNDTITVGGDVTDSYFYGGEGDDVIMINTTKGLNTKNEFHGGVGNDSFLVSGEGNALYGEDGNDTVTFVGFVKNAGAIMGAGDDKVYNQSENDQLDHSAINFASGNNTVNINGTVEYSSITCGAGKDNIKLGHSTSWGMQNSIKSGYGDDTIVCNVNQYLYLDGGDGMDTISCNRITSGIIMGGFNNDIMNLTSINKSFIGGWTAATNMSGGLGDEITVQGRSSKNIIYGSNSDDSLELKGNVTRSFVTSGRGYDTISVTSEGCQYNTISGGYRSSNPVSTKESEGKYDTFNVSAGKYNTYVGGDIRNVYNIDGGANNLFIGLDGLSKDDYEDIFLVSSSVQNYSQLLGLGGYNFYGIDYRAKMIIDASTNGSVNHINLVGARFASMDIKYDSQNDIFKLNDIYILGSSKMFWYEGSNELARFGDKNYASPTEFLAGVNYEKVALKKELDALQASLAFTDKTVQVSDIAPDLELVQSGITSNLNRIVSEYTFSK